MDFVPTTDQFVCVLNKKIEHARLFNALGHMTAGLVALHANNLKPMRFQFYFDKDGGSHKSISDNGYIVLKADNSNKIRDLRILLLAKGTVFTDFTSTMTVGTYAEQHENTHNTSEANLEYFGICFFMNKEEARELTKKFSLFT
ncbi:DUF2000 domain-containing protein [Candidatus Dojkabacteria bacterium CG_4_9_14_3_um_filter_150_Dojkabacteria_WS6_41_13]|uniref:DUF2000 domain-containing protein n=1 Tax=Candidatus Dojkabacteria bacterium CG_4_10_14_0_2_um_filter_Dojkabacteria_WS6_41_15 TaxID=2014249 RepID=A0A2M7W2Q8_9BACT|nr:MAG: DUF2000 domain-containing protein [Candidatus Dojkabacteria bacterium CG_4_10_14_3_um_filter_Dojkabacteria_WS6_41_9]PJA15146.1 MAG: DUF2000 domain-containing protein [Candidatus Dojkabacteria bacterium CG_4_10_14_0_2_um_filter_Dojkabacteria_WS6_41_15]PJB23052.1 MAG: DUF2000 domain-containing protein [Candidatus Dojkabacteria bacterium CG_4_9_14_3_um_filter_150_Dojkabacteria_WS6_41_13]